MRMKADEQILVKVCWTSVQTQGTVEEVCQFIGAHVECTAVCSVWVVAVFTVETIESAVSVELWKPLLGTYKRAGCQRAEEHDYKSM
jgi:hypothetical protein